MNNDTSTLPFDPPVIRSGLDIISIGITGLLALLLLSFGVKALIVTAVKYINTWKYLIDGGSIIQAKFDQATYIRKSNGRSFEVLAPDNRYVFVSSPDHIKEVDATPDTILSLQAASKQMLQPVYTMHRFNWFDVRGTEGVGFVRALRTLLTNNLPNILPDLSRIIRSRFSELQLNFPLIDGARHIPVYPTIVQLVVLTNAVSFFGEDLAKNEQFMVSALAYVEETLICAEIVKLVPKFLGPVIGGIIARRLKSHDTIYSTLLPVAEQRCLERENAKLGRPVPKHADCIQWIMETSPKHNPWSAHRVVHELMAIWFGSVHALSTTITFAIHDLCLHPEYIDPLRKELDGNYETFERTAQGLLLLDSFIKESARLTPVEAMSTRRSAIQPFTLSDGTHLKVGDWLCTPVKAMMQSPEHYPDPLQFSGFRFADPQLVALIAGVDGPMQPQPSKLADVNYSWHVWGTGRMACPGRYYAVAVMKVILGQMLLNYDCELVEPDAPRWFTWRSTMLPKEKTLVTFAPRSRKANLGDRETEASH
ncbi:cytochrome P450 [Hypoxylon sp. FL1857]|nr:cytochrome P450 [Hypoxylon sp. FL1857]